MAVDGWICHLVFFRVDSEVQAMECPSVGCRASYTLGKDGILDGTKSKRRFVPTE